MHEPTATAPAERPCAAPAAPIHQELLACAALQRVPGIGPRRFRALLTHFGSARDVLAAGRRGTLPTALPEAVRQRCKAPNWRGAERDLAWGEVRGRCILGPAHPQYPALLRHLPDPPPLLFVAGKVTALAGPCIAVVGTRRPTPAGRDAALALGRALASAGITVVSGLALGIDRAGHEGALEGAGDTVAVFGCGLEHVYPRGHQRLAERIVDAGALVSEFPPDCPPRAEQFPRRNRIISGLAHAVVVVEAARRSGSLITARLALEQGREVMAMPGAPSNPFSEGANWLLRQGATLVRDWRDVLEELAPQLGVVAVAVPAPEAHPEAGHEASGTPVLSALADAPQNLDTVVNRTGLEAGAVRAALTELELRGAVESLPGGLWGRRA